MIGISATDTCKLIAHHRLLSYRQGKNNTILSFAGIIAEQLFTLATKIERRQHISFGTTNDDSVSDMSGMLSIGSLLKRGRQWNFQEWMTEKLLKTYYDTNNDPHPLCQLAVKVGGAKNKKL